MTVAAAIAPAPPIDVDGSAWTLLCVDDERNILSSLRRLFRSDGYRIFTAENAEQGLEVLERETVDVVISDMRMPGMDGAQFLARVRERWPDTVRLLLTGYADMERTVAAINNGEILRYIAKPWNDLEMTLTVRHALGRKALEREKARLEALTKRQNAELASLNASLEAKVAERTAELAQANTRLQSSFLTSIKVFSGLIELRGGALAGHSRRTAELARRVAVAMGQDARVTRDVFLAGLLHDVGKIGFGDELLATPVSELSGDDFAHYRQHPQRGEHSLMALEELRGAARIVRSHHERFDGAGFPDGLCGEGIPIGARIVAVANDYDGLQSGILVKPPLHAGAAAAAIMHRCKQRYDPAVVEALLDVTKDQLPAAPIGETVLATAQLQPGMVLARDVVAANGALLLAADYVLDARLIEQLRNFERSDKSKLAFHVRG